MRKSIGVAIAALGTVAAAVSFAAPGHADGGVVFELAIKKGTIANSAVIVNAGVKIPVSKFKGSEVTDCVTGAASGGLCRDALENDPGGVFYVYCDDRHGWRVGTNPDGTLTTDLVGNVDPNGNLMMSGVHALSGMRLFFVGKASGSATKEIAKARRTLAAKSRLARKRLDAVADDAGLRCGLTRRERDALVARRHRPGAPGNSAEWTVDVRVGDQTLVLRGLVGVNEAP